MKFELLPTLDIMAELYQKPLTVERFQDYLKILQGDTKDDLAMPVGGYNPMAKAHVLLKLEELRKLRAEEIISETLNALNKKLKSGTAETFKVALNISDDLQGGWTNRFTSDYDSKFKINPLVKRKFCAVIVWSGEMYTEELIHTRTLHACYRTLYWLQHPKPETLQQHVEMEKYVVAESGCAEAIALNDFETVNAFYQLHKESRAYELIFNFLYGDAACESLAFPTHGIKEPFTGFAFAARLTGN